MIMKNLKVMSILFGSLMALASMTACNKDNEEPEAKTQVSSLRINYSASVSQQLLDVANVTVRFIGDNGQVASEQMSATTWTKAVTIALPARAGLSIQPTLKPPVAEGEYTLSAQGQMTYTWLDKNGEKLKEGSTEVTPVMTAVFYAESVPSYLNAIATNCQVARAFDKNYSITEADIVWGGNTSDDNTQNTGISDEGATGDNR
jgi:hypothetical protein